MYIAKFEYPSNIIDTIIALEMAIDNATKRVEFWRSRHDNAMVGVYTNEIKSYSKSIKVLEEALKTFELEEMEVKI